MTVYGYLRVSTHKQNTENSKPMIEALMAAEYKNIMTEMLMMANQKNLGKIEWVEETVSGKVDWRKRKIGKLFEQMQKGDTLIIAEFSRIGRNSMQSIEFLAECHRKGIKVLSTAGDIPLENNAAANLQLYIRSYQSQVEREDISRRTKLGLQRKKAEGIVLGRKPRMVLEHPDRFEENKKLVQSLLNQGVKRSYIADQVGCKVSTLRKFINKYELKEVKKTKVLQDNLFDNPHLPIQTAPLVQRQDQCQ